MLALLNAIPLLIDDVSANVKVLYEPDGNVPPNTMAVEDAEFKVPLFVMFAAPSTLMALAEVPVTAIVAELLMVTALRVFVTLMPSAPAPEVVMVPEPLFVTLLTPELEFNWIPYELAPCVETVPLFEMELLTPTPLEPETMDMPYADEPVVMMEPLFVNVLP